MRSVCDVLAPAVRDSWRLRGPRGGRGAVRARMLGAWAEHVIKRGSPFPEILVLDVEAAGGQSASQCDRLQRARTAATWPHRQRGGQRDLTRWVRWPPGAAMNITVWGYVDQLNISVFTDDLTLDDPHEAVIRSFCKARSAVGLSGGLSAVDTAMAQATRRASVSSRTPRTGTEPPRRRCNVRAPSP